MVHLFERLALDQDLQKLSDPKVLGAAQPKQLDTLVDAYLDLAKAIGAFGPKHSAIMQVEPKLGKKLVDSFARVVARAPLFTSAPNTTNSKREVSPGFLHNMVALGHVRPVSSLDDPRLKDPQSLLRDGWVTGKFGDSTQFEFKDLDGKTLQRYSLDPGGRYIQSFHWVGAGQAEDELLREQLDGTTRRRTSDLNPLSINVDSLTGAPSWETVHTSAYRSYRSARIGDTNAFLGVGIRDDGSVVVQVTGNGKVLDAQIVATKEGRVIKKDLPSVYATGHRREQEIGSRAIREHLQSMLEQLPAELKSVVPQLDARVVATRLT
ncbi:MAG: hypothetical protein IPG45_06645 [Deltaproteobacteria bacterium]|nr:hypothetical protein [Deltaproteobacteria bacterium]